MKTNIETTITKEEWKDIIGYENYYQVSNLGRVRSLTRLIPKFNTKSGFFKVEGRIMKLCLGVKGYPQLKLCLEGKSHPKKVHRLVAETFIPNPENKPAVNHKDGDKANNRLNNLEWVTNSENTQHASDMGLMPDNKGENSTTSILKSEDIPIIRKRLKKGDTLKIIGKDYGVSGYTIFDIKRNKSWKHIPT